MLYKLSLKNIKKSFKDYAIYFITLLLGVAIFYIFNAIDSQTVLMDVTSSTKEIIKLMTNMLSGVSVFVSIVLGFLIIYASRFLIKRRNKEFGIYLTLGMSKRKISTILLIERKWPTFWNNQLFKSVIGRYTRKIECYRHSNPLTKKLNKMLIFPLTVIEISLHFYNCDERIFFDNEI